MDALNGRSNCIEVKTLETYGRGDRFRENCFVLFVATTALNSVWDHGVYPFVQINRNSPQMPKSCVM